MLEGGKVPTRGPTATEALRKGSKGALIRTARARGFIAFGFAKIREQGFWGVFRQDGDTGVSPQPSKFVSLCGDWACLPLAPCLPASGFGAVDWVLAKGLNFSLSYYFGRNPWYIIWIP